MCAVEKSFLELDPKEFTEIISAVAFSSAIDTSRPVLSGIYVNYDKDTLTVATTDGVRLSE